MESNDFSISSCQRKSLSAGTRIFNFIIGLLIVLNFLINFTMEWVPVIIMGVLSIVYALIGKDLFQTKNSLIITQSLIQIKESFSRKVTIEMKDIKHIQIIYNELQIDFVDYTKSYDISWMSTEEIHRLKEKLKILNY